MHRSITHTLAADHWHFTPTRAARTWQRIQSDTLLTATPACVHAERAQLVQSDTLLTATPACVCAARAQLLQSNTLLTATPACVCAARSGHLRTVSAGHWRVWVLHEWVRCQGEAWRIHGHGRGRRCESRPGRLTYLRLCQPARPLSTPYRLFDYASPCLGTYMWRTGPCTYVHRARRQHARSHLLVVNDSIPHTPFWQRLTRIRRMHSTQMCLMAVMSMSSIKPIKMIGIHLGMTLPALFSGVFAWQASKQVRCHGNPCHDLLSCARRYSAFLC
jgi:hypothetical protein